MAPLGLRPDGGWWAITIVRPCVVHMGIALSLLPTFPGPCLGGTLKGGVQILLTPGGRRLGLQVP